MSCAGRWGTVVTNATTGCYTTGGKAVRVSARPQGRFTPIDRPGTTSTVVNAISPVARQATELATTSSWHRRTWSGGGPRSPTRRTEGPPDRDSVEPRVGIEPTTYALRVGSKVFGPCRRVTSSWTFALVVSDRCRRMSGGCCPISWMKSWTRDARCLGVSSSPRAPARRGGSRRGTREQRGTRPARGQATTEPVEPTLRPAPHRPHGHLSVHARQTFGIGDRTRSANQRHQPAAPLRRPTAIAVLVGVRAA